MPVSIPRSRTLYLSQTHRTLFPNTALSVSLSLSVPSKGKRSLFLERTVNSTIILTRVDRDTAAVVAHGDLRLKGLPSKVVPYKAHSFITGAVVINVQNNLSAHAVECETLRAFSRLCSFFIP